jgi:homocysteine S-methyltransferase
VNCTDPADALPLVRLAAAAGRPVVVYPNSGEEWDAEARNWVGPGQFASDAVLDWVAAGARLVGGCCRVRPEDVAALAELIAAG